MAAAVLPLGPVWKLVAVLAHCILSVFIAYPSSPKFSMARFEFDPSWVVIRLTCGRSDS